MTLPFHRLASISSSTLGRAAFLAAVAASAWLTFAALSPDALYAGDIGVKYAQARALVQHNFRSLDMPYRGEAFDPDRAFMPIRPPFVMKVGGGVQAIFSPVTALLDAAFISISDRWGMVLASWLAAIAVLWMAWRLAGSGREAAAIPVLLAFATPWWFYGGIGWEHAPAVAMSTAAFLVAFRAKTWRAALLAGVLLGMGATIREEVLLLAPALAFAVWLRVSWRGSVAAALGVVAALAAAGAIEVGWFHRPLAAHLQHAVHLLRSLLHVGGEPNPDVPALTAFTWRQRYDTVVVTWLTGYDAPYFLGLVLLAFVCRWFRLRVPFVIALAVLAWVAASDAWTRVALPQWVAGAYRLSPFLVFALLPPAEKGCRPDWLRATALFALVTYLLLAFFATDTDGGKSLGPRLLLPLLPLLTAAAWSAIADYLRAPASLDRWAGRLGVVLVACALAMQVGSTIPAYRYRSNEDGQAVQWLRASPAPIVVADDYATAQLLLPLSRRKPIFLADSQALLDRLAASLQQQQFGYLVLVSRRPGEARFTLPGYRRTTETGVGRMRMEEWRR